MNGGSDNGYYNDAERSRAAIVYLKAIHDHLSTQELLVLHTFFYFDNLLECPICGFELFHTDQDVREALK